MPFMFMAIEALLARHAFKQLPCQAENSGFMADLRNYVGFLDATLSKSQHNQIGCRVVDNLVTKPQAGDAGQTAVLSRDVVLIYL